MAILFLDPFPALGILLVHVARVAIRHSGAAAIPAKELAFCAFSHFSDTSEECNEPVKNVQNGTKKEVPNGTSLRQSLSYRATDYFARRHTILAML